MTDDISIKEALVLFKSWDRESKTERLSLAGRPLTDSVTIARIVSILDQDVNQLLNAVIFCLEKLEEPSK